MFEDMRTERVPVSQQNNDLFGETEGRRDIVFRPKGTVTDSVMNAFGWLDGVKGLIHKYEQLVIVAVLILLLLDCDDNIELLIAAGIMLYPLLK